MKKQLALLPFLAVSTVALAGQVSLYGIIETGVVVQKQKDKAAIVHWGSAFDLGSRWGLRGNEDLGNGTKVGFILENGFNPNTGNISVGGSSTLWGRESSLDVKNERFGRIGVGRIPTLWSGLGSFDMQVGYAFKGGYGLMGWPVSQQFSGNFNRVNNSVAYQSPYFAGFQVGLMYSNGVSEDSLKWSQNTHYYGIVLHYKQGRVNSALGFEAEGYTYTDGVRTAEPKYIINYGLEYKLDSFTPMFAYRFMSQDGGYKVHTFGLSAIVPFMGGNIKPGIRYTFGKTEDETLISSANTDKMTNLAVGAVYEYPLSKRTVLKPFVGYAYSGKAWSNYQPSSSDANCVYNGWQVYLGMAHFF